MKIRASFCAGLALALVCFLPRLNAGETAPNPTPAQPKPVVITAKADNQAVPQDLNPALTDFQGNDAAKQEAATKILIDSGVRGYALLGNLINNPNKDVAKRATEVRQQIEQRSWKMFQDVAGEAEKLQKEPLTVQGLENLRQNYLKMATYTPQHPLRQHGFQNATELQKRIKEVDEAGKMLAAYDAQLKEVPPPTGLALASVQLERAKSLRTLQRIADAGQAAQAAVEASGKNGRLTPSAMKVQGELLQLAEDNKAHEVLCRKLIQEYPFSLEVKYGYSALISQLSGEKRWDDAVKLAQDFVVAFPVDETAQESIYGVLQALMEDEHDYVRVKRVAEWIQEKLPTDRWTVEIPKLIGGCNEYVDKDYAKAEKAYLNLRTHFPDVFAPSDMDIVLQRVQAKAKGEFPKEPAVTDEGVAGAFAKFLKAIRSRDAKAIAALVPKEESEDYVATLTEGGDETVALITFADFIVKKVEPNKEGTEAKITIDLYDAASIKPRVITQDAVKEENAWRIRFDGDQLSEEEAQPAVAPAVPPVVKPAPNGQPKP